MALQKTIGTEFGVDVTYHKIVAFNLNLLNKRSEIMVGGYVDQQAYIDGKSPIHFENVVITTPEFILSLEQSELASNIYSLLQATQNFTGSTIV